MDQRSADTMRATGGRLAGWIRLLLVTSVVISGAFLALLIRQHQAYQQSALDASRTQLVGITANGTTAIDKIAGRAIAQVESIARELDAGALDRTQMLERLRSTTDATPQFYGMTVTYRPFGLDPKRRLYSAYFVKKGGRTTFVQLDEVYDYTLPQHEWYGPAMTKGPGWTHPYFDEAGGTTMITYSRPFFGKGGDPKSPLGVVTVDMSMDGIRAIIESLDLGPSGFGGLVSPDGTYLYHPDNELVVGKKTLQDVARETGDKDRVLLAEAAVKRESGIIEHRSITTGLESWLVFAPVPSTGWSLQNTFIKNDLPISLDVMKRQQINILLAGLAFLLSLAALIFRSYRGTNRALWATSNVAAVLFLVAIGVLWRVSLKFDPDQKGSGVQISDKTSLGTVMNAYVRACELRHTEAPVYVPTGLYLESAQFSSVNDLLITGYVWQKYTLGSQDGLTRGFLLADATDFTVTENYRQKSNGIEMVRWQFRATVRQNLNHSQYPLELARLQLRLVHKDLNHNVVLVPDLAAYRFSNPASLPGLARGLMLPGWQLTSSFFEFQKLRFDTNFGVDRSLAKEDFPSLFFCATIRRNVMDAFLSNLMPLAIVSILLFILVMIASRDERLVGFLQAGSGRVLNICTAMFFVIAFGHIEIRRRMASEGIFYLEYFYFLIYVAILWVSINSVLFATSDRFRLIRYKDNLVSKLLYWPVLMGGLFAISLAVFY